MKPVFDAVFKVTKVRPKSIQSARAELLDFLRQNDAIDLVVDDSDIVTLLELSTIYSDVDAESVLTRDVLQLLKSSDVHYERIGRRLTPLYSETDKKIIREFANKVLRIHPDLNYQFSSRGIKFYDDIGLVMDISEIRAVDGIADYSTTVCFCRYKSMDLLNMFPEHYVTSRKWRLDYFYGDKDHIRGLLVRYLLFSEIIDIISNRKVITYGNY